MRYYTYHQFEMEFDVAFTIDSYGCPSNGWDEPGEAAEISINKILSTEGYDYLPAFTAEELDALEELIRMSVESGDYDPDPMDDYL